MNDLSSAGDEAILASIGQRLEQYRLNRNLTQAELGKLAGLSRTTIHRIESGQATQTTNLVRILRVLGLLQNIDALVPEPVVSPLQLAKREGRARERASGKRARKSEKKPWAWSEDA